MITNRQLVIVQQHMTCLVMSGHFALLISTDIGSQTLFHGDESCLSLKWLTELTLNSHRKYVTKKRSVVIVKLLFKDTSNIAFLKTAD